MLRRTFLASASAFALVGCTPGSDATTTIADMIAELKKTCAFAPEWESIARVITTLVSGFNAAAGAATIVASAIAKQVIDLICNAVKVQLAQMSASKKGTPTNLNVIVNGVDVQGTYGSSS
jgi:hypothetical protein